MTLTLGLSQVPMPHPATWMRGTPLPPVSPPFACAELQLPAVLLSGDR